MKAQKPILHGRDHAPGGADPIVPKAIHYETSPQLGSWLYIEAEGDYTTPHGYVMELVAGGEFHVSALGKIWLETTGNSDITLASAQDIHLNAQSNGYVALYGNYIQLQNQSVSMAILYASDGSLAVDTPFGQLRLESNGASDGRLDVRNTGGTTIMRVDGINGTAPTYHIKTGGTWAPDL